MSGFWGIFLMFGGVCALIWLIVTVIGSVLSQRRIQTTYQELLALRGDRIRSLTTAHEDEIDKADVDQTYAVAFRYNVMFLGCRKQSTGEVKCMIPHDNISQLRFFEVQCFMITRVDDWLLNMTDKKKMLHVSFQLTKSLIADSTLVLGLSYDELMKLILFRKEQYIPLLKEDGAKAAHELLAGFVLQSEDNGRPVMSRPLTDIPTHSKDAAMRFVAVPLMMSSLDGIAFDSMCDAIADWVRYLNAA